MWRISFFVIWQQKPQMYPCKYSVTWSETKIICRAQDVVITEDIERSSGRAAAESAAILDRDDCRTPPSAGMVGSGTAHRLLRTFLELQKACEKASLSLTSDSDGNLNISLKVKVSGHGNQAPRRGGCQPRRREAAPGTLAPSSPLLLLQQQQLQHLPLPEGPGAVAPEPCSETRGGDWLA